jgi:hypothetical protein
VSDKVKYDELRMVLDELNHLGTPDAIAQRLARLEFRSVPGEAYQCSLAHYLQERVKVTVNRDLASGASAPAGADPRDQTEPDGGASAPPAPPTRPLVAAHA